MRKYRCAAIGRDVAPGDVRHPVKVEPAGLWGAIDGHGKLVVPARFSDLGRFHEGFAVAALPRRYRFVDVAGKKAFDDVFEAAKAFSPHFSPDFGCNLRMGRRYERVLPPPTCDVRPVRLGRLRSAPRSYHLPLLGFARTLVRNAG